MLGNMTTKDKNALAAVMITLPCVVTIFIGTGMSPLTAMGLGGLVFSFLATLFDIGEELRKLNNKS